MKCFCGATAFNQDISNWDVSTVINMNQMFRNADAFNQPIGNWDVSSVTDMGNMFLQAVNFNQDISNWDVSTVINLVGMFNQATQFNQNLSNWEFNSFNYDDFISNSGLDINNYDALLEAFVNQNLVNENLNAQNLVYCDNNAREELINNMGWIITGDNYGTECDTLSVCELSVASNGFENGLFNNGAPFWVAQQVVLDGSFTVTNFELNLFHDPGATIDDVLVLYYADEGGQPGEILFQENLTPVSQTVVGANFGLDVSKVALAPTVGELAAGTYWLGTLGTSSIGGTTAWEVSTVAEGENALNTEDGITWGLNSGEGVAVYSLFGQCETENPFDTENPVAICQNINVLLDENGQAIIDGNLLDGGSTDNEGIVSFELDVDTFTCTDIGENTVILTVSDSAGNQATCEATVTVVDVTAPVLVCGPGDGATTVSENFDSLPTGWSLETEIGVWEWTFGAPGAGAAGGTIPFDSNAAVFDDDAAGSGETNRASLLTPVWNMEGVDYVNMNYDYTFNELGAGETLKVDVYDGANWVNV